MKELSIFVRVGFFLVAGVLLFSVLGIKPDASPEHQTMLISGFIITSVCWTIVKIVVDGCTAVNELIDLTKASFKERKKKRVDLKG